MDYAAYINYNYEDVISPMLEGCILLSVICYCFQFQIVRDMVCCDSRFII
jgi:hypothetical protein